MSAKATFWAWDQRGLSSSQKLVLLCLADNHNEDSGRCDPSVQFIADKTALNRKTILRALSDLEDLGLVVSEKRHGTSNTFVLLTSTEIGTSPKNGTSQKRDRTSTKSGTGVVPKLGHKPKTEPKKNLKQIDFSKWPELPSEEVWSDYKDFKKAKKNPLNQSVINLMASELKKLVVAGWSVDAALAEQMQRGWQGLKADWILKNDQRASGGYQSAQQLRAQRDEETFDYERMTSF